MSDNDSGFEDHATVAVTSNDVNETETDCVECGLVRSDEPDYNPIQMFTHGPFGWYSGDDGELCPGCFTHLMKLGNGGAR